MAKQTKRPVDPYPDYRDGNCRDVSGQIVPCASEHAVSRAKYPDGHPLATEDDDDAEDDE
jgi:hypothetical protein